MEEIYSVKTANFEGPFAVLLNLIEERKLHINDVSLAQVTEDYLKYVSYRDNRPIFETDDFSEAERKKITKMGFNLYEKKTLVFRLGPNLGYMAYFLTRVPLIHRIALMVFQSRLGGKLYSMLSNKSKES